MQTRAFAPKSGDLVLEAGVVLPPNPRVTLLLCHGIPSGSPPDPADPGYPGLARDLAGRIGAAAAWVNLRGVRGSPGDFSLSGWVADLEATLDALPGDTADLPRVVVGSSAGGAAAITAAARCAEVAGVATLAAPATFRFEEAGGDPAAVAHRLRNIGVIRDPAFPRNLEAWWEEFDTLRAEAHVASLSPRPLLIVHGDADTVVPYEQAERLFAAAGEPKELVRLPGGPHQLRKDPRAIEAVCDWLIRLFLR